MLKPLFSWGRTHVAEKEGNSKPVVGFIAGETAPKGRTMGHAGAIVGGKDDTAQAKKEIMKSCGIHIVDSPAEIGKKVAQVVFHHWIILFSPTITNIYTSPSKQKQTLGNYSIGWISNPATSTVLSEQKF